MTIVELLVSMAVLVIMIVMANMLVVQARRSVRLSQDVIEANADARAVADRLRADLAGITKDGFLAINYDDNLRPRIVFTSVGTFRSLLDGTVISNFARIDYGVAAVTDAAGEIIDYVLYRRAILVEPNLSRADDHEGGSLAGYRLLRDQLQAFMTYAGPAGDEPTILTAPVLPPAVETLAHAGEVWPYLIGGVSNLRIQWTDGEPAGGGPLPWYDVEESKADDWADKTAADGTVEYDFADGTGSAEPVYGALWSWENKSNWPKAIRFRMELGDPPRLYEIIVDLPH